MLTYKILTPSITVAPQIAVSDLSQLALLGYKSIINNRPDGEESAQPASAEFAQQANELGLEYCYLPVVSGQITQEQITQFGALFTKLPKPVFAFCRTGTRSSLLWVQGSDDLTDLTARLVRAKEQGYDLAALLTAQS